MAIFVCTLKNLILGMVAGTRKSRKGLFLSLQTSMPFFVFEEAVRCHRSDVLTLPSSINHSPMPRIA